MKKYFKLIRIKHYIKNFLIFLPFFFGGELFNIDKILSVCLGFVSFCAISSFIYVINDIKDAEQDRQHPTKCKRPIASGAVKVKTAIIINIFLFVTCLLCNYFTKAKWESWAILGLYLLINLSYSFGLKNAPIIDILLLSSGFILRIYYGSFITHINVSNWLYLSIMSISFYLGLGKRRNELKKVKDETTRKVLKFYNYNFLDKFMYVCLSLFVVFYSLWCVSFPETYFLGKYLILTIPLVIAILMRYSLDIEGDYDGDPVEVVVKDKWLIIMAVLLVAVYFIILYIK